MKKLCEEFVLIGIVIVIVFGLIGNNLKSEMTSSSVATEKPVKVAVIVYNIDAPFIGEIASNLKEIQKENENKVELTFFSSDENQAKQNEIINTILKNKEFNLLFIALVDINSVQEVVNLIKQENIPVIFFNREPYSKNAIKSYGRSIFVGSALEQAGIFQGEILANEWNKNKIYLDRNKDNIMQYIMLKGRIESLDTIYRTRYSILTIKDLGIDVQELGSQYANWDEQQAKNITNTLLLRYGDRIEAIIANNDAMAIGAIEALQSFGYNTGNKERTIAVVGVDAIPEAKELIKKGIMTGTVIQDAHSMAEAMYITGMNLVNNKKPLEGSNYKFDDSGVSIRIPYRIYIPS